VIRPTPGYWQLGLNIRQQILDDIVFVPVRGKFYCIDVSTSSRLEA
jgi:hypothetical protein